MIETPDPLHSSRTPSVNPRTAHLLEEYPERNGRAMRALVETIFMIVPVPCFFMSGSAACTPRIVPNTFMSYIFSTRDISNSSTGVSGSHTPALLIQISSVPNVERVNSARFCRSLSFVTSATKGVAPISCAASCNLCSSRAQIMTFSPRSINFFASSFPSPVLPPVMTTVFGLILVPSLVHVDEIQTYPSRHHEVRLLSYVYLFLQYDRVGMPNHLPMPDRCVQCL